MSKTCECGHSEAVHQAMCGSPHGCSCNKFVPASPVPSPKRFAEMTPGELRQWVIDHDADDYTESFAALRDAILAERDAEWTLLVRDANAQIYALNADLSRSRDAHQLTKKALDIVDQSRAAAVQERDAAKGNVFRAISERDGFLRAVANANERTRTAEQERDDAYAGQKHHKANAEVYLERALAAESALGEARDEIAGFEAMWEAREKAHDAALGEAKREGAREALTRFAESCNRNVSGTALGYAYSGTTLFDRSVVVVFRDREYPAIDPVSGSTCKPDCARVGYCAPGTGCHAPSESKFTHDAECELEVGAFACECPRVHATPSGEGVTQWSTCACGRQSGDGHQCVARKESFAATPSEEGVWHKPECVPDEPCDCSPSREVVLWCAVAKDGSGIYRPSVQTTREQAEKKARAGLVEPDAWEILAFHAPVTPQPEPLDLVPVKLYDGRTFEIGRWEWRKGPLTTYDIVTNSGVTGCESRQVFDTPEELRSHVLLPWADWQKVDATIKLARRLLALAQTTPEGR